MPAAPIDPTTLTPFLLLGNYNAVELWPTVNLILPTWLLLLIAPRWKLTPSLTLVGPIIMGLIYSLGIISAILFNDGKDQPDMDFSSLEGVTALFQDPSGVFIGWVHYCCYDALVGRWIVLDSVERGANNLIHVFVIVPILFMALMFGPIGWLAYVAVVRTLVLPPGTDKKAKSR
ncbi:hypothetical protein ACHAXR_005630 [Thalassiosira sp. AJA248-18]